MTRMTGKILWENLSSDSEFSENFSIYIAARDVCISISSLNGLPFPLIIPKEVTMATIHRRNIILRTIRSSPCRIFRLRITWATAKDKAVTITIIETVVTIRNKNYGRKNKESRRH